MDLTTLADPAALTKLLTGVFGLKLGGLVAAFLMWQGTARTLLKPVAGQIQKLVNSFNDWSHTPGNTEIHNRIEAVEHKPWVRFMFWLVNYVFSVNLMPQTITPSMLINLNRIPTEPPSVPPTTTEVPVVSPVSERNDPGPRP